VIDSDYRGPVKVLLFNFSDVDFTGEIDLSYCDLLSKTKNVVSEGDRIAQLIIEVIRTPEVVEVEVSLSDVHQPDCL
jgi:dUTP pyrophosphatase